MHFVLGALALLAGLIGMARRPPSGHRPPQPRYDAHQRGRTAPHGDQEAHRHQPNRAEEVERQAQDRAAQQERDEREDRHRRREHRYWWVTGTAAVLATIGTLVAAGFAVGAFVATWRAMEAAQEQARTAQAAMVASDRPWIKVTGVSAPRFEVGRLDASFAARLDVKNVGQSPAPRTTVRAKLLPDAFLRNASVEAESQCREAVAKPVPWREHLVFPESASSIPFDAAISMREVDDAWKAEIDRNFELVRRTQGDESALEGRALRLSFPVRAAFTLAGCVAYEIPTGPPHGATTFIKHLSLECDRGPSEFCPFEMDRLAIHEGKAVSIRDDWFSGSAR